MNAPEMKLDISENTERTPQSSSDVTWKLKSAGNAVLLQYIRELETRNATLDHEVSDLRNKLRLEKRNRRILELRNRFHVKIEEILSGLDKNEGIKNLFDYLLNVAPQILGCEARFHFVSMGPYMRNESGVRRTPLFDDLSEIFRTSLVSYLHAYGDAGWRLSVHSGGVFVRDEEKDYVPVILENYRSDPNKESSRGNAAEPLHTGIRTVIGYVEIPKRNAERRNFDPEAAAKKIMRSLRAHLEEISGGLLVEEHKRKSYLDPLTGIFNRRGFFETIEKLRRNSADENVNANAGEYVPTASSVITLDIDHFKHVNDTFGHEIGDEALKYVASSIESALETVNGACLGRFGGEEFQIYLQGHDAKSALSVAENIRMQIKAGSINSPMGPVEITASLGVSESVMPEEEVSVMLNRSDRAMYQAKKSGRDRSATYDSALDEDHAVENASSGPLIDDRREQVRKALELNLTGK